MPGRGRKEKNNPGNYSSDIWGVEQKQTRRSGGKRRGKYGTIVVGGTTFAQDALFQGEEVRIPFLAAPINTVPDRLGFTRDPGTLFTLPETPPVETQTELFTTHQDSEDQPRTTLPVDPQVGKLPDDLKPFVTYVPCIC